MYGPSYQMYPYGPPQQRIPAPSHAPGPRHSASQSTLRTRPSVGTSAGTSRNNIETGPGTGDSGRNRGYIWDASTGSLDPFSAQYRSQSRSQTSLSQKPMNPYQQPPWPPPTSSSRRRSATVHAPDNTGPVIPDLPPDIEAMFRNFGIRGQSDVASRGWDGQPTYAPGRAYGPEPPFHPPGWPAPGNSAPYGSTHLSGPPPGLFGGWFHPSASSFPVPPPPMFGPSMPPPAVPPILSGYRPSQYDGSAASSGAYAKRSSETRERRGRDRKPKPLNSQDRSPPPAYLGVASSQADSTASDPLIHPALGWWPDQRQPALYWDLSSSSRPRYIKREFDATELAASPFTPPLSNMRLVLDPHAHWVFDISAHHGASCITLSSLLMDIAALMRAPNKVPHAFWVRATTAKKEAILRCMLKRTGRKLSAPPPYRRPKSRGQIMEEAVVDGAPNGWTNLLVIDLLGENVMFAGMEFHKGPDEWILRTTKRYS